MPQASYHRQRAADCRTIAHSCDDPQMAAALGELADHYESCAQHFDAEQGRQRRDQPAPDPARDARQHRYAVTRDSDRKSVWR